MAIGATAVWRVRPSGANTNGGGYDAAISGAGTDYSQQDAAQLSGTVGTAAGTTTFSDAGVTFTSAMVGNAIQIASGAGFTAGFYFVTAFTNSTTVVLDRSPGTGSAAVWKLGGGWADFWTNTTANIVPGNVVYVLGAGTPNPASYSFDYSPPAQFTSVSGSTTVGYIRYLKDPATPAGGFPCISSPGCLFRLGAYLEVRGLWLVCTAATNLAQGFLNPAANGYIIRECVLDQNGYDISVQNNANGSGLLIALFNEIFSSTAKRTTNAQFALSAAHDGMTFVFNNVHDCIGPGVQASDSYNNIAYNIVAKNGGDGITVVYNGAQNDARRQVVSFCTVDGNAGNGVLYSQGGVTGGGAMCTAAMFSCIISNHIGAGKFGFDVDAGTTAANDRASGFVDYNTYFGNTTDTNNVSYGANDTHGGADPYVGQSTENYTLA